MVSRDRRFEGRFVIAVTSTRIYCRPGCPAPIPRRQNVRFLPCAAAAESAGFRPCLRCRPASVPGSPAWAGTSATVARALRLIQAGDADDLGLEALAERLGVGARHLRRLFAAHVGAPPKAIAQSRRAHLARQLLEQSALPMAEVAHATGFSSVRRFNDAIRSTFHAAPRELRRRAGGAGSGPALTLFLPYRPPLHWPSLVGFLGARAIPGVESASPRRYARTIRIGDAAAVLEVRPARGRAALELTLHAPASRDLLPTVARVERLFDLGADPAAIAEHLALDPLLAPAVRARPGLRVPGAWDPFELAVRALLGQQVSVRAASTLAGRLVRDLGERLPAACLDGELTHLFPSPERIASASLARIGLPAARAEARGGRGPPGGAGGRGRGRGGRPAGARAGRRGPAGGGRGGGGGGGARSGGGARGGSRRSTARSPSRRRSRAWARSRAWGRGRSRTSRCARSASPTRSRPAIWGWPARWPPGHGRAPRSSRGAPKRGAPGAPTPPFTCGPASAPGRRAR